MDKYTNASIQPSKQAYNWLSSVPNSIKNTASAPTNYNYLFEKITESHEKQNYYKTFFIEEKLEFSDYDSNIVSETALMKDWLLPQEDIAWKDL